MEEHEVRERVQAAFHCLQSEYVKFGGWQPRYGGYLDEDDAAFPGYVGPFAWSEADIQHRFANDLSEQFRSLETSGRPAVHIGLPIRVGTRDDLEKDESGKLPAQQHIDIVVTDPNGVPDGDDVAPTELGRAFRSQQHLAFIEVKWFHKGSKHWEKHNWKAKVVAGVQPDLDRLEQHLAKGRCLVAAMLLVDDTGAYLDRYDELAWPADVLRLSVDRRTALPKAD
jgi:hypothetical protein